MIRIPSWRLRTKILALCLGCTLLALGLQTWFFQNSASALIFRLEHDSARKSLGRMQDELYSWIKGYENALIKFYNQTDLMRDLASSSSQALLSGKNSRIAYTMMQAAFDPGQYVNALYVYTMDHQLVSYGRIASTPRYNYPEDIYADPVANRSDVVSKYAAGDDRVMLVTSSFNKSRGQTILRFVLKLYTNNVRTKIGFVVCDVEPKGFQRIVEKYIYSDRQVVWLQPLGDDPVLEYGAPASIGPMFEQIVAGIRAGLWSQSVDRRISNAVFLASPQVKYRLTAWSLVPQELLEESQNVLSRNMLVIALLVILVAVASVLLIARSLTMPLAGMMVSLRRIKDGETDLRLTGLKSDEIGVLGQSVNEMLDRIQELIALEYNAELQLKHAEYKALQAQVNPHFLYNTLDTMGSIAKAQNVPTVATMCHAMSNLFRYSLDMKDPLSTLGNEIVHLKNYLYVMNVRTGNSLEVDIEIDRNLLAEQVPRLCLQPLVENSVNHGLKNKRGAKKIQIRVETDGQTLTLKVHDNGVGMDADEINRQLAADPAAVTEKNGSIGLGNIHARVVLLFGGTFGISVASSPGEGTLVSLTVPRSHAPEEAS